jgi:hypothetical protein
MRAYLAVLKDSFREAFASRVLWILLALTTLVLVAVAPIGLSKGRRHCSGKTHSQFPRAGFQDRNAGSRRRTLPGKQIWSRGAETQDSDSRLTEAGNGMALRTSMVDELNKLLPDRNFYDAKAWSGIELNDEAKQLAERSSGKLSDDEVKR